MDKTNLLSLTNTTNYTPELSGLFSYTDSSSTYSKLWTCENYKIDIAPRSDWECELFGTGRSLVLNPEKGKEPNWFWRQMQYLCFGNKWKKNTGK